MSNNNQSKFNLAERTAKYGIEIIRFVKLLPETNINKPLINQLVRSATSVGANYMEADCSDSAKDFIHKMIICKKEAKETCYWLQMIAETNPEKKDECRKYWREAHEFILIFSKSIQTKKNKK